MEPLTPSAHTFLGLLAGSSSLRETKLLVKYGKDEDLLTFREIAKYISGMDPLPDNLVTFRKEIDALSTAQTVSDVRKIFLSNENSLDPATTLDFFTDLAEANEREGNVLMTCASEEHLFALRDTAMELLVGKIALSENQEYSLEPFWAEIRELALSKNAKEIGKNLYWHFSGRLLLLQGIVIPVLAHAESGSELSCVRQQDQEGLNDNELDKTGQQGENTLHLCESCPKKFKQLSRYKDHMNTHRTYQEMPYCCEKCGRKYASSWTARRHENKCRK